MNTIQMKITITAGLLLCIFAFGFWLSRSGKPYNQVIFTIHKLIALGAVIYLGTTVHKIHQAASLNPANMTIIMLTALCGLIAFVTGALLSTNQAMPLIVLRLHQVAPYLILLSTSASLYLLLAKSAVMQ